MAGAAVLVGHNTPSKREILGISARTGLTPDDVFGKCVRFWAWSEVNTHDGYLRDAHVTLDRLDSDLFHHPGFASALLEVGWLQDRNGSLVIPSFERYMGQARKKKALAAQRARKWRSKRRDPPSDDRNAHVTRTHNADVTQPIESAAASTVFNSSEPSLFSSPEEEKKPKKERKVFTKPTVEEVAAYIQEKGYDIDPETFWHSYEAKGWVVGRKQMSNWRSAVVNWHKNGWGKPGSGSGNGRLGKSMGPVTRRSAGQDSLAAAEAKTIRAGSAAAQPGEAPTTAAR